MLEEFKELFKTYQSKPIERLAYQIKEGDEIEQNLPDKECSLYPQGHPTDGIQFVAYEGVRVGDYIIFLDESDVYHCRQDVFCERNVVE